MATETQKVGAPEYLLICADEEQDQAYELNGENIVSTITPLPTEVQIRLLDPRHVELKMPNGDILSVRTGQTFADLTCIPFPAEWTELRGIELRIVREALPLFSHLLHNYETIEPVVAVIPKDAQPFHGMLVDRPENA